MAFLVNRDCSRSLIAVVSMLLLAILLVEDLAYACGPPYHFSRPDLFSRPCVTTTACNEESLAFELEATKVFLGFREFCSVDDARLFRIIFLRVHKPYAIIIVPSALFLLASVLFFRRRRNTKTADKEE